MNRACVNFPENLGVYGIRLAIDPASCGPATAKGLRPAPTSWPAWSLARAPRPDGDPRPTRLDGDAIDIGLMGGNHLSMNRASQAIKLELHDDQSDEAILHPWLSAALGLVVLWNGGIPLHAGVIEVGGRGWGILGLSTGGKSTALASLWRAGARLVADDMAAMMVDGTALAGPSYVDLRRGAAERFPEAINIGHAGLRQRWRLHTGPAPTQLPLAGWCTLGWADEIAISEVPLPTRVRTLTEARSVPMRPAHPAQFIDLASLPMYHVARPRDLGLIDEVAERLLDHLASAR